MNARMLLALLLTILALMAKSEDRVLVEPGAPDEEGRPPAYAEAVQWPTRPNV